MSKPRRVRSRPFTPVRIRRPRAERRPMPPLVCRFVGAPRPCRARGRSPRPGRAWAVQAGEQIERVRARCGDSTRVSARAAGQLADRHAGSAWRRYAAMAWSRVSGVGAPAVVARLGQSSSSGSLDRRSATAQSSTRAKAEIDSTRGLFWPFSHRMICRSRTWARWANSA